MPNTVAPTASSQAGLGSTLRTASPVSPMPSQLWDMRDNGTRSADKHDGSPGFEVREATRKGTPNIVISTTTARRQEQALSNSLGQTKASNSLPPATTPADVYRVKNDDDD